MSTFVDTSAFCAVGDRFDRFSGEALKEWNRLLAGRDPLVTTNYVLVETAALLQKRLGIDALRAFAERVREALDVVWVDEETHEQALRQVLAIGRRGVSLVDCVSFEVMRREGLRRVFTFDPHYAEAGFECLPAPPPAAPS